ncbi:MAG: 1-acyl-sn-glycerol-3-phosphate acyltransferase [Steroidobacteraceae bacterium]|nr:1-acyl-sn-glycerol-3-phosphate acyltransferase [Steroidobacteraceae bacterium]
MRASLRTDNATRGDAWWARLLVTAFCFIMFGLGALVLGLVVFPLFWLLPGGERARRDRARRTLALALRAFVGLMSSLGGISYEIRGAERLGRPGQLVIANHPTLCDVIFLLGFSRDSCSIVKHQLFRNWFTALAVTQSGYVKNEPTDAMVEHASTVLASGQSLIVFPQGTRSRPGEALRFHRGAAAIAIRAAEFITPVFIWCTPVVLGKGQPWYAVPARRPHFVLQIGDDLPVEPFRSGRPGPVAARQLNQHLIELYEARLSGQTLH